MKMTFFVLACILLGSVSAVELYPDKTEIVVAPDAPSPVRFAAKEMESFLGRVLGAKVPQVNSPSAGKSSIVLGANPWSRAAGVNSDNLPDDGFCIAVASNRIYICGKDDDRGDFSGRLKRGAYGCMGKRGTLFGVYEFLERYAGCRFFFPGEMGTVVPRRGRIDVPDGRLEMAPYFTAREPYFLGDGVWIDGTGATINDTSKAKALNWHRLRLRKRSIPCCHGQNKFMYVERFAKSHPEYFQLRWDKTRCDKIFPGLHFDSGKMRQLCHSSKVYDEMFKDIVSYMRGEDASVRGIPSRWEKGKFAWGENCRDGKYIDIMPQDGYQRCWCEDCRKAYAPYKGDPHFATELVWRRTAELGNRLKEAGVDCVISQMAYVPYGKMPEFDLPDNIYVVVAQGGPWSRSTPDQREEQIGYFRKWSEKVRRRVGFWTYPQKLGSLKIPTVPAMAPRAWGEYYKLIAPYVDGGFCESESDRSIYNYLNYYVFSKVSWDVNTDVEEVLADHHEKMFGAGAKAMAKFYDALEEKWIYGITVNFYDSPYGPLVRAPNEYDIWKWHYSEETLKEWEGFFTEALSCVPPDSDESKRIVFIREQFLNPLLGGEARKALLERSSVEKELVRRSASSMPNLVANSDLETMDGWIVEPKTKEGVIDGSTSAVGKSSLRLVADGKAAARCRFSSELKMDTKYRVSFFVKMDNVRSKTAFGGIFAEIWDGHTWIYLPHLKDRSLFGTRDWSHVSYEFKTSPERTEKLKPFFHFLMNDVTGTAWFDGVRIEEVAESGAFDDIVMTGENAEVVVSRDASPAACFAAEEMTNFLSMAFGTVVPLKTERSKGKVSVVLGDGQEARELGLDVKGLVLDAFSVVATRRDDGGGVIVIAGRDDPKTGPRLLMKANFARLERTEKATLNGAYDFLERNVGVRFYFPGEIGTVVPKVREVRIPLGKRTEVPDFLVRKVYLPADGIWYEGEHVNLKRYRPCAPKSLNWMRLRLQSGEVPCVHGQSSFRYTERFGATHPEYFQLKANGRRNLEINPKRDHDCNTRQLCHTSRVWDEIHGDAKAYLTGRPASERGLKRWEHNTYGGRFVDIMPQDGLQACHCERCKAAYTQKHGQHYATELIWSNTVNVANRLRAEGVDGFVTQMAYTPYAGIPSVDIPDNVKVMVAEGGPWSMGTPGQYEREWQHVRDWSRKVRGKVWLWTYLGKISSRSLPLVPQMTPKAYGKYFQTLAPHVFGAFCETESDRAIYNYLNYYVFAKIGWDNDCDVSALLDEHYRLMFGAGAGKMKEIYEAMERKWLSEICGGVIDTPLGPVSRAATFREVCSGPYSPQEISRIASMYDEAFSVVRPDSMEARRIAFIRQQFHEPLAQAVLAFADRSSPTRALDRRVAEGKNRSVLQDADTFDRLSDAVMWNINPKSKCVKRDETVFVTGPSSLRIECDRVASVSQPLGAKLEPGTRYRISFFLKIDDIRPNGKEKAGVFFQCYDTKTWHWFPKIQQFGSVDWFYEEYEFTTLPGLDPEKGQLFEVLLRNVTGRIWIDDVRIEKVQ